MAKLIEWSDVMSEAIKENQEVCEACGCAAEMGFIIKSGDEVATVQVFGQGAAILNAEFERYVDLAKTINQNIKFETSAVDANSTELTGRIQFECSAEKIIFELKSRSLAR